LSHICESDDGMIEYSLLDRLIVMIICIYKHFDDDILVVIHLFLIGNCYSALHEYENASHHFSIALNIREFVYGDGSNDHDSNNHSGTIRNYYSLMGQHPPTIRRH
jgi:hypothetical protein